MQLVPPPFPLAMVSVITLSLPDVEGSFSFSFAKVRRLLFGTDLKSELTLVKTHSSNNFISFAFPSA